MKSKLAKLKPGFSDVSRFSKLNLTVFALIFAALGSYFLLFSHASSLTGDINNDGTVNAFDLSLLLSSYGQTTTTCISASQYTCDLNSDGHVNVFDLSILLSHFGETADLIIDDSIQGTGQNQWNYQGAGWTHCTSCNETNPTVNFYNASQSWDSTTNGNLLPLAVAMELTLAPTKPGADPVVIRRFATVMCATPPSTTSTTGTTGQ